MVYNLFDVCLYSVCKYFLRNFESMFVRDIDLECREFSKEKSKTYGIPYILAYTQRTQHSTAQIIAQSRCYSIPNVQEIETAEMSFNQQEDNETMVQVHYRTQFNYKKSEIKNFSGRWMELKISYLVI